MLRLHRAVEPAPDGAPAPGAEAMGHLTGSWTLPDGTRVRALLAVLHGWSPNPPENLREP
ncbi:hypothetical protein [Streptomyces dubilierae]|uniref:Uncharacterized protein n=1 Tax=Streptomyces dubilierae TaxID=3075533 RepID=A0ABU2P500_9ACTN|nr:hypothetical protein [Streptomyces sp. DSM 41921]MDT0386704.1 hypothetical protein [Streptomyces sp. DSM 41921]